MAKLKSIAETHLFREYNKSLNLQQTILKLTTEGKILSEDDLKDNIMEIDRRYYFTSKATVLEYFRKGQIKVLFNDKQYRLPNTIPAYLVNTGHGVSCIVNVSNYLTVTKEGIYQINTRTLYTLMQAGAILAKCFTEYDRITSKSSIIKAGSNIYSKLFSKVINKMYNIVISPERSDLIVYLSSMFFLENVMGRTSEAQDEMNKKYALDNCKSTSRLVIEDSLYKFKKEDFKDLDTFIRSIAANVFSLDTLTTREFTSNYINSYGPSMMLSLEFLPIFLHNLFAVMTGAFINNQNVLETLCGKEIDKLFVEFFS